MEQFEDRFPPYYFWRDGGGEFQEYYDGRYVTAGYYAPLTHSLALTNGTGSPTLTRSTAMWEFDNEGKMISIQASAAAFGGARRVRNLLTSSEDFTVASWNKVNTTFSGGKLSASATTTSHYLRVDLGQSAEVKTIFFEVKAAEETSIFIGNGQTSAGALFNLSTGTVTSVTAGRSASIVDLTGGWYRCIVTFSVADSAWWYLSLRGNLTSYLGDGASGVFVQKAQLQVDQTASEYVSVGALAAPYHGAGIDGVKWFNTNKDGTPIAPSSLLGLATNEAAVTNTMLYCRDFTNAAWVKTNVTAALTQTGLDNAANSCSLLTAAANDGTILQTITAAASAGCAGFYVKRSVGTGTISITRDNGSTWTDITSLINSATFTKVKIENTSITNPVVGFKFGTSGDAIIVDGGINHLGTKIHHLPILTTSAAVTVQSQTLTYPDTGNIIDADGTIMATVTAENWAGVDGSVVGSTTRGLFATATGASAKDGTNTPTGASDTPTGTVDIGMKYTTDFMRTMSDAGFGTATDYTGTLATDLTNIGIGSGFTGHIKEVAIWQEVISDYKMRNMP